MSAVIRLLLICACLESLAFGPAVAFDATPGPKEAVLLLRNGQVLRGRILKAGDRYLVTMGETTELRIAGRDVELCCEDLEEAYQLKRTAVPPGNLTAHLQLADWCLRQNLHAAAADLLLTATALNPADPRIVDLERRLNTALHQSAASPSPPAPAPSPVSGRTSERPQPDLPPAVIASFTAEVQPLLINRCGATTCHGSATSSSFSLCRSPWGTTMPRRLTQHNLNQVLRHVDLQQPEASPLVTVPAGPHGGLQTPVFATGDKQFDRVLRRWVQQAVPQQPSPAATPLAEHPRSSLQQASYFQPVPLANRAPAAGPSLERGISQGGQEARGDRAEMGPPTQDPFSAEVFNQQFGRRAPPGESR